MKQNEFYEVDGCTDFIPVKLIEEYKHMTNNLKVELTETGNRTFVPHIYSFQKAHEPKKPVIPKFVAEWLEECKRSGWHLQKVLYKLDDDVKVGDWAYDENDNLISEKVDMIARAWLDGYEVERDKLYTVEIPDPHGLYKIRYLFRNSVGNIRIGGTDYTDIFSTTQTHLTESEIKQDFEWAWQFAKPVEVQEVE